MGGTYMTHAFVGILALFGENGLTKEEILQLNSQSYRAPMEKKEHFDFVDPRNPCSFTSYTTEFRDGKFHIKKDAKIDLKRITTDYLEIMKEAA